MGKQSSYENMSSHEARSVKGFVVMCRHPPLHGGYGVKKVGGVPKRRVAYMARAFPISNILSY